MDTHDEEPNKSESEKIKIEAAAKAAIMLEKSHTGTKKFSLATAVRETGIFDPEEPDKNLIQKVKRDMERLRHLKKTVSRPSLGSLQTPGEAKNWAGERLYNTESKLHYAANNYKLALGTAGINVSVGDIRGKRNKLKRKERQNKNDESLPKSPADSNTTTDSSFEDRTTSTVSLSAVASTPDVPTASDKNYATSRNCNSMEDRPTAMDSHSAVVSTPAFQGFDEPTAMDFHSSVASTPAFQGFDDPTAMDSHSSVASTPAFQGFDDPTAMDSHLSSASTPAFQGFDEHDHATPQTAALGRRLEPIFEEQDPSSPSQDFLAQQEPRHAYSQYDLKKKKLMMDTFLNELLPAFIDVDGNVCQDLDINNAEHVLCGLVDKLRSRTVARTTAILDGKSEAEAIRTPHPPIEPQFDPKNYPVFASFGVPLNDDRIMSAIKSEVLQRNSDKTHNTTLHVKHYGSGKLLTFVPIPKPKSASLNILRQNQNRTGFLDKIAVAIEPDSVLMDEPRKKLCSLLATDKVYRPFFRETAHSEGFAMIDRLDEATSFAIQSNSGINDSAARLLRRNFTAVLGAPILAPESNMKANLGFTRPEIVRGLYVVPPGKKKQRIHWSCKKLDQIVRYYVEALAASERGTDTIDHSDLVVSIDHGKGFLRAILTITVRAWGHERESSESFALAEAKCNGDTYEILKETFASEINDAFQRIKDSGCKVCVWRNLEDDEIYSKLGADSDNEEDTLILEMTLESWIAGDLKFFMMATGRESGDKAWCFYCDLMARQWKLEAATEGTEWTNVSLKPLFAYVKDRYNGLSPFQRKGCNKELHELLFNAIEIDHFSPPILHLLLGLANCIYTNLVAELQAGYELYTDEYFELETAMVKAEEEVAKVKEERRRHELFSGNNIKYWKVITTCWAKWTEI